VSLSTDDVAGSGAVGRAEAAALGDEIAGESRPILDRTSI
jgi:hypothetical protein